MKKVAAVAALSLAAMGAQAAQWELTDILQTVPFGTGSPSSFDGTVLGFIDGVVVVTANWQTPEPGNTQVFYSGLWGMVIGDNTDVIKLTESCIQGTDIGGTSTICGRDKAFTNRNGLEGDWISGQDQNGDTTAFGCNMLAGFQCGGFGDVDVGALNFVNVTLNGTGQNIGDTLVILRQTQFSDNPNSGFFSDVQSIQLTYTLVPVPGAVWLFASGLGLIAWMRRRAAI